MYTFYSYYTGTTFLTTKAGFYTKMSPSPNLNQVFFVLKCNQTWSTVLSWYKDDNWHIQICKVSTYLWFAGTYDASCWWFEVRHWNSTSSPASLVSAHVPDTHLKPPKSCFLSAREALLTAVRLYIILLPRCLIAFRLTRVSWRTRLSFVGVMTKIPLWIRSLISFM